MIEGMTICVGTVGSGVHVSRDGGGRFKQIFKPVPFEGNVRALRVDPANPANIWAGTDAGLFRTTDGGVPLGPVPPRRTAARSGPSPSTPPTRSGSMWAPSPAGSVPSTAARPGPRCRFPSARSAWSAHPVPRTWWSIPATPTSCGPGAEIDGVFRSTDRGETWARCTDLGPSELHGDVHGVAIRLGEDGNATVMASGPFGLTRSVDEGESWELTQFGGYHERNEFAYCRHVLVKADDPDTIFVGTGDSIPGVTGGLRISRDGGATWQLADLPETPNSVVYWLANHPDRPEVVACATLFGQLFWSTDAGRTWERCARGFGEIRSLVLAPTVEMAA